jgi:hypothetical protein
MFLFKSALNNFFPKNYIREKILVSNIIPLNCVQQPYMNKLMICSSWFGHLLNVSPLCGLYPVADALVLPISSDRCPDNGALYAGQCAASHAFNSLKGHSNEKGFFTF